MNIEFFILKSADSKSYLQFVADQVKAYYQGNKPIVIYAEPSICQALDKLLWFDQEDSFIPHFYVTKDSELEYINLPVLLVSDAGFLDKCIKDTLIDLSLQTEVNYSQFSSLIKIVDQEPYRLKASRVQYKQLQQQGYQIQVHNF
ncbi:DNA polymerase III subunit chi [Fastidiosibacter lacustris]|uniref:DNA polymerase III subunit chi n=1 Tax=Fastidiosibacter lacustris TaxID=2056695 RepID=UPI0013004796|nr:DNA polymerase III subunit chi [Fastidiosibacter lacustris]